MSRLTKENIGSLSDAMAYYTDCNIATYEWENLKKSTGYNSKVRLYNIAKEMLDNLKKFNPNHFFISELEQRLLNAGEPTKFSRTKKET